MSWQAIRSFQMGDRTCESTCGHFHKSAEAAAKCGYRLWSKSGPAPFSEVVRYVGSSSAEHHAGDEIGCHLTDDGHIELIPRPNRSAVDHP